MKRQVFRVETDGFNGAWYPCAGPSKRGIIAMLGDSAEDYMASSGAKWLNRQGIHVLTGTTISRWSASERPLRS